MLRCGTAMCNVTYQSDIASPANINVQMLCRARGPLESLSRVALGDDVSIECLH